MTEPKGMSLWEVMGGDEARDACVSIAEAIQVVYWGGRRGRPIGEALTYLVAGLQDSIWRRRRYKWGKPSWREMNVNTPEELLKQGFIEVSPGCWQYTL